MGRISPPSRSRRAVRPYVMMDCRMPKRDDKVDGWWWGQEESRVFLEL